MAQKILIVLLLSIGLQLHAQSDGTVGLQRAWVLAYNAEEDLQKFYGDQSGILLNDDLSTKAKPVAEALQNLRKTTGTFEDYTTLTTHQLYRKQKIEVGEYVSSDGTKYNTLIAWSFDTEWKKEFETIYPAANTDVSDEDIQKLTQSWEALSNAHRPDKIVSDLYVDQGLYFNQGKVYRGDEVADVYSYMTSEKWKIKLEALSTMECASGHLLNVGTYNSGGKGLYILIWKKVDEEWKLLLDFNY